MTRLSPHTGCATDDAPVAGSTGSAPGDPAGAMQLSGRNLRNERARALAGLPLGTGVVASLHAAHTTVSAPI
ncbi:hypothetical protein [Streptomyces bohaiensis]|uniref:Uncharacterized protein n=1 Tax=Streptomyces bohaiensis TaxID=1431344 RepID=A0ABX1C7G0_9ACTN|nr:hypothetical protein [Streptomyces bohaiensis]NJQ14948.1 hypothetical protein [Streptomyces bohaiensis]